MEETFEAIVSVLSSLEEKEMIGSEIATTTGTEIVTDTIQEDNEIRTRNVLIAMAMVTGPVIVLKNETKANATTAESSDINLENVRNEKLVLVQSAADRGEEVTAAVEARLVLLDVGVLLLEEEASLHVKEVLLLAAEALLHDDEARALLLRETTTSTTTSTIKFQVLSAVDTATVEAAVVVVHRTL